MRVRPTYNARLPLAIGILATLLLLGGIGYWSVRTQIAGAVIANGMIVVENNRQVVQHAQGGVVGVINVRDGDHVVAGGLLLTLDDTLLNSELAIIELQLVEIQARRARLEAERDGADHVVFPAELDATRNDKARQQLDGQRNLFFARRATTAKELGQISERIKQTRNQIAGAEAQLTALKEQKDLVREELKNQETLLEKNLVEAPRVSTTRREIARLAGEIGSVTSDIAQYRGAIAALEIEKLKLATTQREAAITELRDLQFRELALTEEQSELIERIARLDIRAPVSGIVYGSRIFGNNAVVQPAEALMYVVPQDQPLVVSARAEAIHVDQVFIGQEATLRFTAFNQRRTPEVKGHVTKVSADVFQDEVTGVYYYRVELIPSAAELAKLETRELMPGMPVEAFLRTDDRTPISYLTKPLADYFKRSMREG